MLGFRVLCASGVILVIGVSSCDCEFPGFDESSLGYLRLGEFWFVSLSPLSSAIGFLPYSRSFKLFLFLIFMEHLLYFLLFLIFSSSHRWKAKRQQLYSKVLMDEELFEAYSEGRGITRPFQRSSLRLSQPYRS